MLLQQSKVLAGRRSSSLAACPQHHHHHQRVWAHRVDNQSRIVTDRTAPTYGRQAKIACRSSSHPATGGPADSSGGGFNDGSMDLEAFLAELRARRGRQAGSEQQQHEQQQVGRVYLVGTGPGDPGLLTLRAVQLMQTADVVLYDRLVSDDVLRLVHNGARMVYVGKSAGYHTRPQSEIHELLLQFAEAGATVVRLKGGDPYVFGRGGEEVAYLTERGVRVLAVPGVTAAAGICAELGIPMTHRGVATAVRFLTGHARDGDDAAAALAEAVAAAADPHTTLVVYMGLGTLPALAAQLSAHGLPGDTPAVAVERGTTADARAAFATLETLEEAAQTHALRSPTLLVIGRVVALAPGWAEWQAKGRPRELATGAAVDCARLALPDAVDALALGGGGGALGGGLLGSGSSKGRALSGSGSFTSEW